MSTLRRRAGALRQLRGPREIALFAYVNVFAIAVPLLMRLPLPRLAAVLSRPPRRPRASAAAVERLDTLVGLAPRFADPLVRPGCLTRGLTLFWFLRRAGVDVELCFGLDATGDGAADGHCWLVRDGRPFLERDDPRARFGEIFRLPAGPA